MKRMIVKITKAFVYVGYRKNKNLKLEMGEDITVSGYNVPRAMNVSSQMKERMKRWGDTVEKAMVDTFPSQVILEAEDGSHNWSISDNDMDNWVTHIKLASKPQKRKTTIVIAKIEYEPGFYNLYSADQYHHHQYGTVSHGGGWYHNSGASQLNIIDNDGDRFPVKNSVKSILGWEKLTTKRLEALEVSLPVGETVMVEKNIIDHTFVEKWCESVNV